MLKFEDPEWEEQSPGEIAPGVQSEFLKIINRLSSKGSTKAILEHFKDHFGPAGGEQPSSSSSTDWALSDLMRYMNSAAANAPLFIDAFFTGCKKLAERHPDLPVPSMERINRVLSQNDAGYVIRGSVLVATRVHEPIAVPERAPTLDDRAEQLIAAWVSSTASRSSNSSSQKI